MKSSLRSLVTVVLAILAGTFFSVRGYLETLGPRMPHPSSTFWAEPAQTARTYPTAPERAPMLDALERDAEVGDSVQDDSCPTCAVTLPERSPDASDAVGTLTSAS